MIGDVPAKVGRIADIVFIIAFAFQGAVWARELILGAISRRVAEDSGEGTLANAMALIRVLVSVALFAIALIVILDNLGVNVTALIAGLGVGGIAIGLAAQGIFFAIARARGTFLRMLVRSGMAREMEDKLLFGSVRAGIRAYRVWRNRNRSVQVAEQG